MNWKRPFPPSNPIHLNPMQLDDLHFLLTPTGQQWLQQLAHTPISAKSHLQIASQLRKKLPPAHAQAVLETAVLRQRATTKFSRANEMYFMRTALEQASSEEISNYRSKRFHRIGASHIADLGCSIGGDALALAAIAEVTGVEWDPIRIAMAQENARVYGHGQQFHPLQADLTTLTPLPADAYFFDPARRDERGRRFFSVHDYQPPLSLVAQWRKQVPETAVKISPGVDYAQIPAAAEIEFISINGEVKEGVLWFGKLHSGVRQRATLLPGAHTLTDQDLPQTAVPISRPKAYLYEPDGAVIRAHLVQAVAQQLQAHKIDESIAYLTADTAQQTPFARCFTVEDTFPFQLKRLRHYLHDRQIGHVTIKKRGSALDPDTLRKQLRLRKDHSNHCILFLTFIMGETAVIIGQSTKDGDLRQSI
ncbi:MAG: class I SAM-dependent methyltransferase [Chloroflexi bacterium]|nr:class I SAM-dependent methyltransferase [Chloroflexota bacterium]